MQVYIVNFNTDVLKVEADVVTFEYQSSDDQYENLLEILEADGIDILDYNDEIAILVDDLGFQKSNNPIYQLVLEDGHTVQLAGKLLFARNIYNEYSTDWGSITKEDVFHLRRLLNIQILGTVR